MQSLQIFNNKREFYFKCTIYICNWKVSLIYVTLVFYENESSQDTLEGWRIQEDKQEADCFKSNKYDWN